MIQVNLLPGSAKKSRERDFNLSGMVSGVTSGISDKYLVGAVGTAAAVVLTVGFLFIGQTASAPWSRESSAQFRTPHGSR